MNTSLEAASVHLSYPLEHKQEQTMHHGKDRHAIIKKKAKPICVIVNSHLGIHLREKLL